MKPPVAAAKMLIRRPVNEVFQAFTNPAITSKFWFTRSSGPLQPGETVKWYWDMYGASVTVKVIAVEENRRILVHWPTAVEWQFVPRGDTTTMVTIVTSGFTGSDDDQVAAAIDTMGGFCFSLAGCKAWLEHGLQLKLVEDHSPDHHVQGEV